MLNYGFYRGFDRNIYYEMNIGGTPGLSESNSKLIENDCGPDLDIFNDGDCEVI